jgi:CheY-like chemotaxis protein/anti-sigma regulatory factor (Ser/Thr protein kinase)
MNSALDAAAAAAPARVLVVDDDPVSRFYFQKALEQSGCQITTAENGPHAQQVFPGGLFDCALIDYRMPGMNGIELLDWLYRNDPDLAAIMVTAEGEKELVQEALNGGACGFLNKPVSLPDLLREVDRALERSRERRRLARAARDVEKLGKTQSTMIATSADLASGGLRLSHFPFHEAGGDFLVRLNLSDHEKLVFAADMSGHDLETAFLAAHVQGLVRGALLHPLTLSEIGTFLNDVLVNEWGPSRIHAGEACLPSSIAVSALMIDEQACTLNVMTNGNPLPVLVDGEGRGRQIGDPGFPLGWFANTDICTYPYTWEPGGSVHMWTDGVEDLAGMLRVDPLAVAFAMGNVLRSGARPGWLEQATDDVMSASILLQSSMSRAATTQRVAGGEIHPLLFQTYERGDRKQIDHWQQFWRETLEFGLPGLSRESLFDILLCAREAVLNGLHHGCQSDAEVVTLTATYRPQTEVLRLIVRDPGPGHNYPVEAPKSGELPLAHRGLAVICALTKRIQLWRNGAELCMDLTTTFDGAKRGF